jgi:hypothetical protein
MPYRWKQFCDFGGSGQVEKSRGGLNEFPIHVRWIREAWTLAAYSLRDMPVER